MIWDSRNLSNWMFHLSIHIVVLIFLQQNFPILKLLCRNGKISSDWLFKPPCVSLACTSKTVKATYDTEILVNNLQIISWLFLSWFFVGLNVIYQQLKMFLIMFDFRMTKVFIGSFECTLQSGNACKCHSVFNVWIPMLFTSGCLV